MFSPTEEAAFRTRPSAGSDSPLSLICKVLSSSLSASFYEGTTFFPCGLVHSELDIASIWIHFKLRGFSLPFLSPSGTSDSLLCCLSLPNAGLYFELMTDYKDEGIVPKTSIRKLRSKARDDSGNPIFMVHPVQGTVELLEDIASLVTRPVWGLECSDSAPMESAQALAAHYVENVRSKQARGPYTILAYSLGSVFALEMAIQLESESENVSLTLLDGSPDFVKGHIQIYYRNQIDPSDLDAFRWPYVTMLFTNTDYSKLSKELQRLPSSQEKAKRCARLLGCSETTFHQAVDLFWKKLEICKIYTPTRKLKSRIRLIKASENFVNVGSDYDLAQYSESGVDVITVPRTTHQTIITGIAARRVAEIVCDSSLD